MTVIEVLSGVLLAAGGFFVVTGAVGLVRFPDFYTRIHAVGVTDSAGAGLILLGLLLRTTEWEVGLRLLIIMLFMVITSPTAAHTLAQAARRDGVPVWRAGDARR
ncbi:monovalent cation/H(+) antiporter subunit G [Saccharothrix deserti]|uniref:monovalent cation/H(+) antiporter subunit G n=1 Tax=Saccharothrix deserti TaxID=2593674 RepID=UPI00131D02DA|nr:monovalent cation/H(+) antiporter subunit G [Saccharothrix deserti]